VLYNSLVSEWNVPSLVRRLWHSAWIFLDCNYFVVVDLCSV